MIEGYCQLGSMFAFHIFYKCTNFITIIGLGRNLLLILSFGTLIMEPNATLSTPTHTSGNKHSVVGELLYAYMYLGVAAIGASKLQHFGCSPHMARSGELRCYTCVVANPS